MITGRCIALLAAAVVSLGWAAATFAETPAEQRHAALVMIGTIAFESPDLLGGTASALGMSCASCHPRGGTQTRLFIDTLSDKPGNVDVTNGVFSPLSEDNIINPSNIPSLFGARHTEPFGRRGNFETIADFTIHAIVTEFIGQHPSDLMLEALVAFQSTLDFPANRYLDEDGNLTDEAPDGALRGEAIFTRPGACGTCHRPNDHFVDHKTHDVGTDGEFETPSLRGMAITAPYAHDGRFDTVAETVDHFVAWLKLDLTASEKADLLAYVETVGAVDKTETPGEDQALRKRFSDFADLMERLIALEDPALTTLAISEINNSFKAIQMYYRDPPHRATRKALGGWMEALRVVEREVQSGERDEALAALAAYRARIASESLSLASAEAGGDTKY